MTHTKRATFGSKIGVILATVGCAVGLGNIWRFPYMLGENGGAAFLLVYISCILFLGIPVMITEFFIGRYSRKNAAGAFKVMAPGTKWSVIGYNGVAAAFLILGYYAVVSGWTLEYIVQAFSGSLEGKNATDFADEFTAFSTGVFRPILWTVVFIALTHIIIVSGVKEGIERASKVMMPVLFLILIALCVRSITLPGASEGLTFLFNPDFSKIDSSVVLSAMGQAFFSLSIGMGCLITYASYFGKQTNLQTTALQVTILDTLVAVLAVPNVFEQLPFGNIWSFVFFVLLALAALTSTISLHEVSTAYVHEEYHISRKKAAIIVSVGVTIVGILCSLSMGVLSSYTLFGLNFFNLLDFVTAKIMLPLGGMMICIFTAKRVDKLLLKEEVTNHGTIRFYFFNTYAFFVKYIAPIAIGLIFLNELGLLNWLTK